MSPEVLAHAVDSYLDALHHQVRVAEAFFFGRLVEGMEGLLQLPEAERLKIDQLIWTSAGGEAIDPTEDRSGILIARAIMQSLEGRMGIN